MSKSFWQGSTFPIAVVHRGGAGREGGQRYKKENTLNTFKKAGRLGYQYLELDVTSTADHKVIVVHVSLDPIEKRVRKDAPDALKMQSYSHQQLNKLLERDIPSLEQVIKALPDAKFFIDPKTDEVAALLAAVIKKTNSGNRVFINSFFVERVRKIQQQLPAAEYGIIINRYPRLINKPYRQLLKGEYHYQGFSAAILPYKYLNRRTVNNIHGQGLRVVVWTPNTAKRIKRAIGLGADGIMSDNAELLAQILIKS